MALLPRNRWVDITLENEDIAPAIGSRIFAVERLAHRHNQMSYLTFANPPVRQTLSDFITTAFYDPPTTAWTGMTTTYEYQDLSTDRYSGMDAPFGVVYMLFTKTAHSASPQTYTQHLKRLIVDSNGVVNDSTEYDFPSSSKYLVLSVDQNIIRVLDRESATRNLVAFTLPTSGRALVRSSANDVTATKDLGGFEFSNGVPIYYYTDQTIKYGANTAFSPRYGATGRSRQLLGISSYQDPRELCVIVFVNDAIRGEETLVVQHSTAASVNVYQLVEYSKSGSLLRTLGPATLGSNFKIFVAATLVARSSSIDLYQFKLKSEGVEIVGKTEVTNAEGVVTDIIPQRQVLTASVLGLPVDLQALNEWTFDYDDLTYTMESIASTENPAIHELTFSFAPST